MGPPDAPVELSPLHPRVRVLWGLQAAAAALAVTMLAGGVAATPLPFPPTPAVVAVIASVWAVALVTPPLRYRRWRYTLRAQDLWIRHGTFSVVTSVIPLARLQFVDTRQGPLERALGLAQLVVHTAAPGTSGRLPGLETAQAERLRERLAQVAQVEAGV